MKIIYSTFLLTTFLFCLGSCSEKETPRNCVYDNEYADFSRKLDDFIIKMKAASCEELKKSAVELLIKFDGCPSFNNTAEAIKDWREIDCALFDL